MYMCLNGCKPVPNEGNGWECRGDENNTTVNPAVLTNITQSSKHISVFSSSITARCNNMSDKKTNDWLETLDERLENIDNRLGTMEDRIDDRLETLGDIVEQQQIAGQCSNDMTGSFHNPAHNCSTPTS